MAVKVLVCFMAMCVAMAFGWATTCTEGGTVHQMSSTVKWNCGTNGVKRCKCINPDSTLWFWEGDTQSGDAIIESLFRGCPTNAAQDAIVGHGETFTRADGVTCTCLNGTPDNLMDANTLVHGVCPDGPINWDF